MKKILILVTMAGGMAMAAHADVIVKKDGTTMNVHNVEETGKWILYTVEESADSELKRISIDEVFGIRIGDGEMQMVGKKDSVATQPQPKQESTPGKPMKVEPMPSPDNDAIINLYNTATFANIRKEPNPKKFAKEGVTTIWGFTTNSVLKDEHLLISFDVQGEKKKDLWTAPQYIIKVQNLGDEPVYVDMTNSFKMIRGDARPFCDGKMFTTTSGSSTGASIGLGAVAGALGVGGAVATLANGITVGGSNSSNVQVTESTQPVVVIPPHGMITMPLDKSVDGNKVIESGDMYGVYNLDYSPSDIELYDFGKVEINDEGVRHRYLITYSTSPDFSTYTQLPINMYIRGILGCLGYGDSLTLKGFVPNYELGDNLITGFGSLKKEGSSKGKNKEKSTQKTRKK